MPWKPNLQDPGFHPMGIRRHCLPFPFRQVPSIGHLACWPLAGSPASGPIFRTQAGPDLPEPFDSYSTVHRASRAHSRLPA